jgi:DNA polymerase-3 subunit epsilon
MQKYLTNKRLDNLQLLSKNLQRPISFVDLETTGLLHEASFSIIEIGFVHIYPDKIIEESSLVSPNFPIPRHITEITSITNAMVKGKPTFKHFLPYIKQISHKNILAGFNSRPFDSKGLELMGRSFGEYYMFENQIDVRQVFIKERNAKLGVKGQSGKLTEAGDFYKVELSGVAHRAGYDIALTALLAENIIADSGFSCLTNEILKFSCANSKAQFNKLLK